MRVRVSGPGLDPETVMELDEIAVDIDGSGGDQYEVRVKEMDTDTAVIVDDEVVWSVMTE